MLNRMTASQMLDELGIALVQTVQAPAVCGRNPTPSPPDAEWFPPIPSDCSLDTPNCDSFCGYCDFDRFLGANLMLLAADSPTADAPRGFGRLMANQHIH